MTPAARAERRRLEDEARADLQGYLKRTLEHDELAPRTPGVATAYALLRIVEELERLSEVLAPLAGLAELVELVERETCQACADATGGQCIAHQQPECTCYELIGGHQQGCQFYGKRPASGQVQVEA